MAACNPVVGWCCEQGYMPSRCYCLARCFATLSGEAFLDSYRLWSLASDPPPNKNRSTLSSQHRRWPNRPLCRITTPRINPDVLWCRQFWPRAARGLWGNTDIGPRRSTRLNGCTISKPSRHEAGARLEACSRRLRVGTSLLFSRYK